MRYLSKNKFDVIPLDLSKTQFSCLLVSPTIIIDHIIHIYIYILINQCYYLYLNAIELANSILLSTKVLIIDLCHINVCHIVIWYIILNPLRR